MWDAASTGICRACAAVAVSAKACQRVSVLLLRGRVGHLTGAAGCRLRVDATSLPHPSAPLSAAIASPLTAAAHPDEPLGSVRSGHSSLHGY